MKAAAIALTGLVAAGLMLFLLSRSDSAERLARGNHTTRTDDEKTAAARAVTRKAAELDPVRPTQPPDPARYVPPVGLPHPEPPPDSRRINAEAWQRAIVAQAPRPGEAAFRATAEAFVQHNQRFAEATAESEGLSLEEVRELTYFGLVAQETQRWEDVAQLVGRDIGEEDRQRARTLLDELNREFKAHMRQLVADRVSVDERWELIRATQARYSSAYFAITGMNEELLDVLLAGDASRAYAASTTPPGETEAPSDQDPVAPRQRPQTPPEH